MTPSSIGISFLVSDDVDSVVVTAGWGEYCRLKADDESHEEEPEPAGFEEDELPPADDAEGDGGRRRNRPRWKRQPAHPPPVALALAPEEGLQRVPLDDSKEITLEHLTRPVSGHYAVSVFLVNRRPESERGRASADRWIFQPTIVVRGIEDAAVFQPRDLEPSLGQPDRDLESNRLLYRNKREFAVGHGCGAEWTVDGSEQMAHEVRATLIPDYELPRVEARALQGDGLEMAVLANVESAGTLRQLLEPLTAGYRDWIETKRAEVPSLDSNLQPTASEHLDRCVEALERVEDAINLLESDEAALQAFRFANEAMLLQRSHTVWAAARRKGPETAPADPVMQGRWRPFQLAFILLNLRGLAEPTPRGPTHWGPLWFPTGGGKTEAYLGLTAFTLAYRRLRTGRGPRRMRGSRCSCATRCGFYDPAVSARVDAHLRVRGHSATRREAVGCSAILYRALGRVRRRQHARRIAQRISATPGGESGRREEPCQLESCPWCGETLTVKDYIDDGDALERTRTARGMSASSLVVDSHRCP